MGKISNFKLLVVGLAVSFSFVVGWTANAREEKPGIVWEYRSIEQYYGGKPVDMNALGAEGWELVTVTSSSRLADRDSFSAYYFKRRK